MGVLPQENCPCCKFPLITLDGYLHCLSCKWTDEPGKAFEKEVDPGLFERLQQKYASLLAVGRRNLLQNKDGSLDYCLQKRKMSLETIQRWEIGYLSASDTTDRKDWKFNTRVIFPIRSNDGKYIVGMGGRIFKEGDKRCKYINSDTEGTGYEKSKSLYGICNCPEGAKNVFVCEGYLDAISMTTAYTDGEKPKGYAVATLGTAFTAEQARLLRAKQVQTVCLCFDMDEPGRRAVTDAVPILWQAGYTNEHIRVVLFDREQAKDVDEAIKNDVFIRFPYLQNYLFERYEKGNLTENDAAVMFNLPMHQEKKGKADEV